MATQRVVVITGGGTGMGRAMAHRFAKNGDQVYIIGRRIKKLDETAKAVPNTHSIAADLTNINEVKRVANEILKAHKSVDVLVNNAGGITAIPDGASLDTISKAYREIIATNLDTAYFMITVFTPVLTRPGGRIINISSTAALMGSTSGSLNGQAYSAVKAGIHGLSRTLIHSLSQEGITINTVAPGVVDETEFFSEDGIPQDRQKSYKVRIPLGRLGKPEEIAGAVFYLASEEASFINGEILNINGGMVFGR